MADIVRTTCGECAHPVTVNVTTLTLTTKVPSNGKRGFQHVPAHLVSQDLTCDETLVYWECPLCGYADSTYADPGVRRNLA